MNQINHDEQFENEIDLLELFHVFMKNIWIIAGMTITGLIIALTYTTFFVSPTYRSEATIFIQPNTQEGNINLNDLNVNQRLVGTYTELAKSNAVLSQVTPFFVSEGLSVDDLRQSVNVSTVRDTQIIKISALTTDAELSARITNRVVSVFIDEIVETMEIDNLRVIDPATVNEKKVGPNRTLNTLIGGVLGMMISVGFVFLRMMLDRTIHNRTDAEKTLGLPVLGEINFYEE